MDNNTKLQGDIYFPDQPSLASLSTDSSGKVVVGGPSKGESDPIAVTMSTHNIVKKVEIEPVKPVNDLK